MKTWTMIIIRKSRRGQSWGVDINADTAADARKIAEQQNPGWIVLGTPRIIATEDYDPTETMDTETYIANLNR